MSLFETEDQSLPRHSCCLFALYVAPYPIPRFQYHLAQADLSCLTSSRPIQQSTWCLSAFILWTTLGLIFRHHFATLISSTPQPLALWLGFEIIHDRKSYDPWYIFNLLQFHHYVEAEYRIDKRSKHPLQSSCRNLPILIFKPTNGLMNKYTPFSIKMMYTLYSSSTINNATRGRGKVSFGLFGESLQKF